MEEDLGCPFLHYFRHKWHLCRTTNLSISSSHEIFQKSPTGFEPTAAGSMSFKVKRA
jgi:hypothetical protein